MDPINKPERRKAYWSFLGLFLACVAIIALTALSGANIPLRQNKELIETRNIERKQSSIRENFTESTRRISTMVDSLDLVQKLGKVAVDDLQARITAEIDILLKTYNSGDESVDGKLYAQVIQNLRHFFASKQDAIKNTSDNSEQQGWKDKYDALNDKFETQKKELNKWEFGIYKFGDKK